MPHMTSHFKTNQSICQMQFLPQPAVLYQCLFVVFINGSNHIKAKCWPFWYANWSSQKRCLNNFIVVVFTGFPAEPGNLETREIWIISVQVWKWPGIYPKKWENLDKTRNFAENLDKTWNVKIYKISILSWDEFFHFLYSCKFRTSLVSAFWCQNCPHYNLENDLFDLDKTWR